MEQADQLALQSFQAQHWANWKGYRVRRQGKGKEQRLLPLCVHNAEECGYYAEPARLPGQDFKYGLE